MTTPMFTLGTSTISYVGYDLSVALDHVAATGYRYVEIAAVEGGLNHLTHEDLTSAKAKSIARLIAQHGLAPNALSAHSPLTRPDAVERFGTRLRFAAELGSPICVTTAGPKSERAALSRNLSELLKIAERLDVLIALETNADLVTTAEDGAALVREFNSPWLGLNYDAANVYRGTNGRVDPVADFKTIADTVSHVHIKDIGQSGNGWMFRGPEDGILDMDAFIACLAGRKTPLGINLELPYRLRLPVLDGPIEILSDKPSLEQINQDLQRIHGWTERAVSTLAVDDERSGR